ncbi:response regulator [Gloeothece verrucosa]|uniref:Multi-component transcriptional regulator, winged helix family n=1 Tax=Gloeothece verrucosa (strain PCC 7822) TaxID=497965 RepID=E0U8S6_GLOV7|nr:response regulator [Gloeothece verrucosa]ADN14940.1 multi-component transcriptional regulator, winged helix family [Gloeothece verrucosa PCC 7822]
MEDDPLTRTVLTQTLSNHHYNVDVAKDGKSGLQLAQTYNYDLFLLDVVVPVLDGISVCQQLRSQGLQEPIVLLTAKDSSSDQIIGLDAGADDYIIKPVNLETLMARIRALLRRKNASLSSVIEWGNLQLNLSNCEVNCENEPIHLTAKEYALLELFLVNPKRIFNRRVILERLWDIGESPGEETVSTHIKCLRQKLKNAGVSDPIETVYGLGYRLRKADEIDTSPNLSTQTKLKQKEQQTLKNKQKKVVKSTLKTWDKFKQKYQEQIEALEQLILDIEKNIGQKDLSKKAADNAHKLAGSLGVFGLHKGSRIAKKLEELLELETKIPQKNYQKLTELLTQLRKEIEQASPNPLSENPTSLSSESGIFSGLPPMSKSGELVTELSQTASILMIDDDLALAERVRIEAQTWNLNLEIATDLTVARQIILQKTPAIIILDLNFDSASEDGFTLLEELNQSRPNLPIIIFTGRESLNDRIKVARLGAKAFLHKPLAAHQILKTVTDILHENPLCSKNRVMIVDDDLLTLTTLVNLLKPLNIEVITCHNPNQFWEMLTTYHPNLLVLDLEMPQFNGLELCQVVRQDPTWNDLPILFLSIYTDEEMIQQMFAAGADDYISKQSDHTDLINHIIRRLKLS